MGVVGAIFLTPEAEAPCEPRDRVRFEPGRGPKGDRYFRGDGDEPNEPGTGRDITLIEAEAIEGLASETGIELAPGEARRNVVTRGLSLNDLVGKRFTLGEAECVGRRLCDPCSHLEQATQQGVLKGLARRGGLRADIVSDGRVEVGSPLRELPD